MKTICIVTGSRAEYGLLKRIILRFRTDPKVKLDFVVTGSHLQKDLGSTITEIEKDGIEITTKIYIPMGCDTKADMAYATAEAISAFAGYFEKNRPDLLIILGDRFEIFAVAYAAAIQAIPIAHIGGGQTTEGAVDEFIRHSITKMSYLHFSTCKQYCNRIIQMGEDPSRVFNVGSPGVENIITTPLLSQEELQENLCFDLMSQKYCVVTFHPETMANENPKTQLSELVNALNAFPEYKYIITLANADAGGKLINNIWIEQAKTKNNWLVVPSLGMQRYLSALKYAEMMIGNSSSGIIEGPAMHIPTVNIGDRQKGRIIADSIISCCPEKDQIKAAIEKARTPEFRQIAKNVISPFGIGNTSEQVYKRIMNWLFSRTEFNPKKKFYDIHWEEHNEEHCNYPCQEQVKGVTG
jgi:GDP/UDP-N,N'-diacetylbacillosamine 2-epimerase (hydrolysing)